jgi:chemotaxis protein MotB
VANKEKPAAEEARPVIIRRKKVIAGGHHGGAWKVAYADFVTALMAFFLVMWLVASVNDQQKSAIFEYFKNPSMERGLSSVSTPGGAGPGGASTSPIELRGGLTASAPAPIAGSGAGMPEVEKNTEVSEKASLETLRDELREAIEKSKTLEEFKDQLLLDITPEGLRIQIVDAQNRPMFDLSGTQLKPYARELLLEVGKYLATVPNRVTISGHTDETPFAGGGQNYTNWELSADRANTARRTFKAAGLPDEKFARIIGMSSYVLLDEKNPRNPMNRRISVVVMTKQAEEAMRKTDNFENPARRPARPTANAPAARPAAGAPASGAPAAVSPGGRAASPAPPSPPR